MKHICPNCHHESTISLPRRTVKQNDRYWGMIIPAICEETGMIADEVHEEMKRMFNYKPSKFIPGEKVGATTTTLTTAQFNAFTEQVEIWAIAFLGVEYGERDR